MGNAKDIDAGTNFLSILKKQFRLIEDELVSPNFSLAKMRAAVIAAKKPLNEWLKLKVVIGAP